MFIARAMCGLTYVILAAVWSTYSLQKYLERWPAALCEAGWSVSVNVNERIQDPENWTQYSPFVTALFAVYAQ